MAMSSCTDTLEKEPLDEFQNSSEFWNSELTVEGYANTFYNQFYGFGKGDVNCQFYRDALNDNQCGESFARWYFTQIPSASSDWTDGYENVRHANVMIAGLTSSSMDAAAKNHWLGVARLMRAYDFYQLVRQFGDVIWVDKPLETSDADYLYAARMDRDAVMDKVLEDLDFACTNINEGDSKISWTRTMANAMKADICLWEGTFRKYRKETDGQKAPDAAGSKKYLEECVKACEYVMGKVTSLSPTYQEIYNSVDLTSNPEIVFFKAYKQSILSHSLIAYTSSSTQISGMNKDAFDSYLFIDGKPKASTSENNTDAGVLDADGVHINISNLLAVRDKRLSETIDPIVFTDGSYVSGTDADGNEVKTDKSWSRTSGGTNMTSSTGYGVCKYDNTTLPLRYRNQTGANYTCAPVYWLSVIYLNYAEAKAELGTITDGDIANTINKLHQRAGLPDATVASLSAINDPQAAEDGVSSLLFEIRRERRCELMFDNMFRYWDLIRWHQLDKLDTEKHPEIQMGANIVNDPHPGDKVKLIDYEGGKYVDGSKGMTRKYESKYYLYPIPSDEKNLNGKLGQNPGW